MKRYKSLNDYGDAGRMSVLYMSLNGAWLTAAMGDMIGAVI